MNDDARRNEGFVSRAEDVQDAKASTILLMKGIGDALEKHYPGWMWAIQPDDRGGVLNIRSLRLSGEWGYVFLLRDIQDDPRHQKAVRAAGEILERFGVPRGTYRYADWKGAPKDIGGVAFADITDKPLKVRRHQRDAALTGAVRSGRVKLTYQDTVRPGMTHRRIAIKGTADG